MVKVELLSGRKVRNPFNPLPPATGPAVLAELPHPVPLSRLAPVRPGCRGDVWARLRVTVVPGA